MGSETPRDRQGEKITGRDRYYRYPAVVWPVAYRGRVYAEYDGRGNVTARNGRIGFVVGVYCNELHDQRTEFGNSIAGEFETREAANALLEETL
jgi:hypothetical protein